MFTRHTVMNLNYQQIASALSDLLDFGKRQVERSLEWIKENPDKAAILCFAIAKAYSGDYRDLMDLVLFAL